jgi:hypothetical protein
MSLYLPHREAPLGRKPFDSPLYPPISPLDSGYGSAPATPERRIPNTPSNQPVHGHGPVSLLGRNQSIDHTLLSENADDSRAFVRPDVNSSKNKPTLPRPATRSRLVLPKRSPLGSGTNHLSRNSDIGTSCPRVSPLQLPDRFVPFRDQSAATGDKFRTSMPVDQLTPAEKLLRKGDATEDAFSFRRVGGNPMLFDLGYTLSRPSARAQDGGQFSNPILVKILISPRRRSIRSWPYCSQYRQDHRETGL